MPNSERYDAEFYEKFLAGSLRSARTILPEVMRLVSPGSVADVGCGLGAWLHVAKELGVSRVTGIDGGHVDRAALLIDLDDFVGCELEAACAPVGAFDGWGRFDLTMCLEVAEHLPPGSARPLVRALTSMSDVVLFSAAIPFQGGVNHVNEQWPEYWATLFESHGFVCSDCLRHRFWDDGNVEWWYAQNILMFAREGSTAASRLPVEPRGAGKPLSQVHPLNYICRATGDPYGDMQRWRVLSSGWSRR